MNVINQENRKYATIVGYGALFFWTTNASLTACVQYLPMFEVLAVAFGVSFLMTLSYIAISGGWHKLKQPLLLWVVGALGIYANDALYLAAFKLATPAQVDLISYLWPILVVLLAGMLPNEKFTLKHGIAAVLGFIGVYCLVTNGQGLASLHANQWLGYSLALLDAIVWSMYTLFARHYGKSPPEMVGIYCGFGMLFSIILHYQFEVTVMPTHSQWLVMIVMGLTTQGLAYFLWDIGVKLGNFKLLSILSYSNPILSVTFLVLFGFAEPSMSLGLACFFVAAGGLVAGVSWPSELRMLSLRYLSYFRSSQSRKPEPLTDVE